VCFAGEAQQAHAVLAVSFLSHGKFVSLSAYLKILGQGYKSEIYALERSISP